MQLKKIGVLLFATACLCANPVLTAYADTTQPLVNEDISLAYEIADNPQSSLAIEDGVAYCTSVCNGNNAVSITVTQTLQKHWGLWIWNDVDNAEWQETVNRHSIYLSNTKSGLDSGTYRVKSVFELIDQNGEKEVITTYSNEQKNG